MRTGRIRVLVCVGPPRLMLCCFVADLGSGLRSDLVRFVLPEIRFACSQPITDLSFRTIQYGYKEGAQLFNGGRARSGIKVLGGLHFLAFLGESKIEILKYFVAIRH